MGIKEDKWIKEQCEDNGMIEPFIPHQVEKEERDGVLLGVISYGLGSYGYDIRIANEFKIFTNVNTTVVDPKNFDNKSFVEFNGDICTIPPNSFALGRSVEYFRIPRDVTGICLGKSTYARVGIVTNFTPLEAGWKGHLTIEISNTTPLPARIYANEGIAQVLFFRGDEPPMVDYSQRESGGKYQGQVGITVARVLDLNPDKVLQETGNG